MLSCEIIMKPSRRARGHKSNAVEEYLANQVDLCALAQRVKQALDSLTLIHLRLQGFGGEHDSLWFFGASSQPISELPLDLLERFDTLLEIAVESEFWL